MSWRGRQAMTVGSSPRPGDSASPCKLSSLSETVQPRLQQQVSFIQQTCVQHRLDSFYSDAHHY